MLHQLCLKFRLLGTLAFICLAHQSRGQKAVLIPQAAYTFNQLLLHNDTLWGASNNGLLQHPLSGGWNYINTTNSSLPVNDIRSFAIDSVGRRWVGGFTSFSNFGPDGLRVFRGNNWNSPVPILAAPVASSHQILKLTVDKQGAVYSSFWYHAAGKFANNTWEIYPDGLVRFAQCSDIGIDKLNRAWIGTNVGLWRKNALNNYTEILEFPQRPAPLSSSLSYILDHLEVGPQKDSLLITSYRGLFKGHINSSDFKLIRTFQSLKTQFPHIDTTAAILGFTHMAIDKNGLLFLGTQTDGLFVFGCNRIVNVPLNAGNTNFVSDIVVDKDNTKWVSTLQGLYKVTDVKADFIIPSVVCPGTQVLFTDKSTAICNNITSRTWNFGDNTPPSTAVNPVHAYQQPGTYQVTLIVTNAQGVRDTLTKPVIIDQAVQVQVVGGNQQTICAGNTRTLTAQARPYLPATTMFNWQQQVSPGNFSATLSFDSVLTNAGPGIYRIVVNAGRPCPDTAFVTVSLNNDPQVVLSTLGQRINGYCQGDSLNLLATINGSPVPAGYTLSWFRNGQQIPNFSGTSLYVKQPGNYRVQYVSPGGCFGLAQPYLIDSTFIVHLPVYEWPLPVLTTVGFLPDTILCGTDSTLLIANLGAYAAGVNWFLDGVQIPGANSPLYRAKTDGVYTAKAYSLKGCTSEISITVTRQQAVIPTLSGQTTFCPGGTAKLTLRNTRKLPFSWTLNGLPLATTDTVINVREAGVYRASVQSCGLQASNPFQVTSAPHPAGTIASSVPLPACPEDNPELRVTGNGTGYLWSTGEATASIKVKNPGIYSVTFSTAIGCDTTLTFTVPAFKDCRRFAPVIPNLVTPNADNLNDTFRPEHLPEGTWQLQVFNRWGAKIYEAANYQNNWPEKKLNDGTYYYLLTNAGTGDAFKGWVEVVQ